ncbi:hypothetical protein B0E48_10120 [Rhodanobacter sp. C03]|nr:hypothetical protein B0E48_10120 [Rhodanobacter sp. C03]
MEGFGFFPGPIDFRVRAILHRPNVRHLSLALGRHAAFVRLEGFVHPVASCVGDNVAITEWPESV